MNILLMITKNITILTLLYSLSLQAQTAPMSGEVKHHEPAHDEHKHQDSDHGHEDEHDHVSQSHIAADIAHEVGIKTALSSPKVLQQSTKVYGRLNSGPEQTSHVRARFSGVIDSVYATIGDVVNAGDLLAIVESNQSLKKFQIKAPISGTIVQRHANAGEITQAQILFSITQLNTLWAEFNIFPSQNYKVETQASVIITLGKEYCTSKIEHILPSTNNQAFKVARAKIDNAEFQLSPGLMIEGAIHTNSIPVSVAVNKNSLQTLEGRTGVFVKHNDAYVFTPVITGQADNHFIEIISGLAAGATYVVDNSFLIKADIQKSEAEHNH